MRGVFVTGTDTGIGKTLVSAWLVRSWNGEYWKPVQSGTQECRDADVIREFAPGAPIHPSAYELKAPLSPDQAARLEGIAISLDRFSLPLARNALVVEGAGGAMVPLNDKALMIDLMARLSLPVVVVVRGSLGTINHTLLTLEALRARHLTVAGVIVNGPTSPENRDAIAGFGETTILAELPCFAKPSDMTSHPALAWRP